MFPVAYDDVANAVLTIIQRSEGPCLEGFKDIGHLHIPPFLLHFDIGARKLGEHGSVVGAELTSERNGVNPAVGPVYITEGGGICQAVRLGDVLVFVGRHPPAYGLVVRRVLHDIEEAGFQYGNIQHEKVAVVLIILLDLLTADISVKALVHVTLLVAVAEQGVLVILKLAGHVLLGLGELLLGHVGIKAAGGPGTDILLCKPRTIIGRHSVGNEILQLGKVQLVRPHAGCHIPVMYEIPYRAAGNQQRDDDACEDYTAVIHDIFVCNWQIYE